MRKLLIIAFFLILMLPARATHIVGGEFGLKYISGSTYQITLNMYFDNINGDRNAIDPIIIVSIFEKGTNRRMANFEMSNPQESPVAYTAIACTSASLSTDKIVYTQNITLPETVYTSANGYYLVWERCCRNGVISNIVNPGAAGQTFYLEFPAVTQNGAAFRNSSPELFPPVSDYACINELFYYNFGGQDPDGDSLVYDMVTPLNGYSTVRNPAPLAVSGPYPMVEWTTGLSTNQQIPGNPTISVSPTGGLLTLQPSSLGLFVFGVRCSEYRNNVKIGEVRRDYQILILNCPKNNKPSINLKASTDNQFYQEKDVIKISSTDNHCFDLYMADTDLNEALTVEAIPVNFTLTQPLLGLNSGIVNRNGVIDSLKTSFCLEPCEDSQGKTYQIDFIVSDDGCSLPKKDTIRFSFIIEPEPDAPPTISSAMAGQVYDILFGSAFTDSVFAMDADLDRIYLTATGDGFNLTDYGMQFQAVSGTGEVKSTFKWIPDCSIKDKTEFKVYFNVTEEACKPEAPAPLEVTFRINFESAATFIPANIFTPNNDGKNDFFELPDLPTDFCNSIFTDIKIYNRWGKQVYKSTNRQFKWDGNDVTDGVYFYVINYSDKEFKGTVTKVR
ncbi:MAG: hypothetical protein COW65_16375 [Cytophagales bacterium CG18_big_fil_WC_8_21_14_2_50_42_9]|nr:MAG: hypothetical protein COW65_16375 [Cytophagales bacterium CG18_big_fil_WC_8_21_14_2_50_42_9]